MEEHFSDSSASSTSESSDIKERLQYHTKLNIKRQLEKLGYDNDVPDDVLEEFIVSMKEQENAQQEDETNRVLDRLKRLDLNHLRATINTQRQTISDQDDDSLSASQYYPEERARLFRPAPKPKKHDPVSRIHQMKSIWAKDAFLKRTGDLNAVKTARSMAQSKVSLGPSTAKSTIARANRL